MKENSENPVPNNRDFLKDLAEFDAGFSQGERDHELGHQRFHEANWEFIPGAGEKKSPYAEGYIEGWKVAAHESCDMLIEDEEPTDDDLDDIETDYSDLDDTFGDYLG